MDLSAISGVRYGSYTSNGSSQLLNLGFVPSYFLAWDITQAGSTSDSILKKVEWFSGMAAGSAITLSTDVTGAYDVTSSISSGGVTAYNGTIAQTFTPVAVTSVSKAAAALVTATAHGLSIGDSVRLYGMTGAAGSTTAGVAQLNGLVFTVQSASFSSNAFTIDVNTSSFNVAGSGGFLQKVFPLAYWQPKRSEIVGITAANPGVVTTAQNHLLSTGDIVRLNIPAAFGMQQLNGQLVEVNVLSATTFSIYQPNSGETVPINTTGYTAFAFPANTNPPLQFAQVIPVGEDTLSLADPKRNTAFIGLQLGSGAVGATSDVWQYMAILGS